MIFSPLIRDGAVFAIRAGCYHEARHRTWAPRALTSILNTPQNPAGYPDGRVG